MLFPAPNVVIILFSISYESTGDVGVLFPVHAVCQDLSLGAILQGKAFALGGKIFPLVTLPIDVTGNDPVPAATP
jgi:hypothetical protein